MTECICAIDQGTQSTRVLLFDQNWRVVAKFQKEFEQFCPKPGWIEHDPIELLQTVEECIEGAIQKAKDEGIQVKVLAVGLTNQRETTLVWDRVTGKPFYNAIVWFDNRTAPICHAFTQKLDSADYFRHLTGLPISTYFSAYKFRWLLENASGVQAAMDDRRCLFGTIDTWIIWNLTGAANGGVFVTDVSNASRTNLMDIASRQWSPDLMSLFGIQEEMLAEIKCNSEVYGEICKGPLKGAPIAGCLGDQQAALLGQCCGEGQAKNTYGTGCFLLLNTGAKAVQSSHGLITTVAFQLGEKEKISYALEGSIAVGGAGVRWLRDNLGAIQSAAESESVAESVPDAAGALFTPSAGVLFVPAFNGILAPHWRDDARGVILGLTHYTKQAHIVRAMLDAIAWQTREVIDAMRDDYDAGPVRNLKVDGGASSNNLLMQIQADYLQLTVRRPDMMETTALGAAFAAAIGIGLFTPQELLDNQAEHPNAYTSFNPELESSTCEQKYQHWKCAVQRSYELAQMTST